MTPRTPKLIALLPAYNEARGIIGLLNRISPYADLIIVVDDCSRDATAQLVNAWRTGRAGVYLIALSKNVGASGALKAGYLFVQDMLDKGMIAPDDLVLEMDSDGQHDPKYIPQLCQPFLDGRPVDVVQARRDFSNYPRYKRFGNRALTMIASALGGFRYDDVESNYRVSRARVFPRLLEYFSGYRYSGAFEVGIILASLKYRILNDVTVQVPFYREGARAIDGLHVLALGLRAWAKVRLGLKNKNLPTLTQSVLQNLLGYRSE